MIRCLTMKRESVSKALTASAILASGGIALGMSGLWIWCRQNRQIARAGPAPSDAIVLGCRPGPGLRRRVQGSVALHQQETLQRIIYSGEGEADICIEMARSYGLPETILHAELSARNTLENLHYSKRCLSEPRAWLISDDWHLPRALHIGAQLGMELWPFPVYQTSHRLRSYLRESVSVLHHQTRCLLNQTTTAD